MSARFEWEATRYEHRDRETGALAVAARQVANWRWYVAAPNGTSVDSGSWATAAGAKSAARKALETWKEKR